MSDKFHHFAVAVSEAARSAEFYCTHLGFTKTGEYHFPERGRTIVFIKLGEVCLELLQDARQLPYEANPAMLGLKHICLETDDVDRDVERLRQAGINITIEPFDTDLGSRIAFFEDPDGLPLELWQTL